MFILEQADPPDLERDEYDNTALHFPAFLNDQPVATAGVVLKDKGRTAKIGRVAVRLSRSGKGVGKELLIAIETDPNMLGITCLMLEAQTHPFTFYRKLGYTVRGDEFLDAGIPPVRMEKWLNPANPAASHTA